MRLKKQSLGINAILNGLQSVLGIIFPLITFPYVSRVLSIDGMGIFNFSNTYVGYFILIAGLGINTYAVREGAKYRENFEKISDFSSQIFSINIISTLLAYIILLLSILLFRSLNRYILCIVVFSFEIFFTTLGVNWLYVIFEDYTYITARNILFKILSIILLFLFVKKPNDYLIYAGISVLANVGSNILNFIHAKSFVKLCFTKKVNLHYHLKPILIIFSSAIATNIYIYSDNTILGVLKDSYAVGIYGVSVRIYSIAQTLLTAILTVTIPRLSALYGKRAFGEYNLLLNKISNLLLILSLPAMTGLMMMSKNIVVIIAGEKYLPSANSLSIITWAMLFSIFSWIFSDCILLPAKRERYLLKSTIITAIINIILNLVLIPFWTYNATAVSTVISELLAMMINGYYGRDIIANAIKEKFVIRNIFDSLTGCIFIIFVCFYVNLVIDSYILSLCISVIVAIFGYLLILLIERNTILINFLGVIKSKLI